MTMVIGRRVLSAFVTALCAGTGLPSKVMGDTEVERAVDAGEWERLGREAFAGEKGREVRGEVVDGVLGSGGVSGWCDDQVGFESVMRFDS